MKFAIWTGITLIAAGSAFAQVQQQSKTTTSTTTQTQQTTTKAQVTVPDLNKNPGKFAGQQVVLSGAIDRLEGPNAFVFEGSGLFNDKILVVIDRRQQQAGTIAGKPMTAAPAIKEDQKVQLTGKVQEITVTEIEETYKAGLNPEVMDEMKTTVMPVLVVPPSGIKVQG